VNNLPEPSPESLTRVDQICDAFESALRRGQPAPIEGELSKLEAVARPVLLRELLLVEWEIVRARGQQIDLQSNFTRFPADRPMIQELFARSAVPEEPRAIAHYKIVRKLGADGMGEVYLAEDTKLERRVALKLLPLRMAANTARRQRFLTEAKAASALNHPHVCVIHEVGETSDQQLYIAMEFVEGETLAGRLRQGRLEIGEVVDIGMQVADALEAAFSRGIVHRDIKPSNICLNERGRVKVLDFGLAKRLQAPQEEQAALQQTSTGHLLGTPSYMSPEQALGRDVDHRTDIFSLGVVLYELVTGRVPFPGASLGEIIDRIARAQPEALARFNYEIPAELERVIRKCLEKDRNRRYQSPRELLVDLQNLRRDLEHPPSDRGPLMAAEAGAEETSPSDTTQSGSLLAADAARPKTAALTMELLKESDIFINYAGIDDQPITDGRQGWVSQLHRHLEVRLQQLTGEPVRSPAIRDSRASRASIPACWNTSRMSKQWSRSSRRPSSNRRFAGARWKNSGSALKSRAGSGWKKSHGCSRSLKAPSPPPRFRRRLKNCFRVSLVSSSLRQTPKPGASASLTKRLDPY
jgi:serine/threonine protein kinase